MRNETSELYSGLELAARLGSLESATDHDELEAAARDMQLLARELHLRLTQLEMQNRALAEARDAAENASRMKDDFLGMISHELRTPLNAILGWSHTLTKRASEPALLQRGLEVMRRNAEALARLVEDMLDVSRIISGKLRIELQPVVLPAVLIIVGVVVWISSMRAVRSAARLDPSLALRGDV